MRNDHDMTSMTARMMARLRVALLMAAIPVFAAAGAAEPPKIVKEVCVACHGLDGNGGQMLIPEYPKLAGMDAKYLKKQLLDFQKGKRKDPVMAPMAEPLSPEQIDEVAAHFAAQPVKPNTVSNPGLLEPGKRLYLDGNTDSGVPSCSGCHLPDGKGDSRYPLIAAQHAAYVYSQLKKFKSGERENDRGLVMQSVTLRMTEAEMKAVAEYVTSIK